MIEIKHHRFSSEIVDYFWKSSVIFGNVRKRFAGQLSEDLRKIVKKLSMFTISNK